MSWVVALLRSRCAPRALALALIAIGAAGCSSESTRFNDSLFGKSSSNEVTGSVQPNAAPVPRVESSSLPPPPASRPASVASTGTSGGGRGMGPYQPSSPSTEHTGTVQTATPGHKSVASGQWTWDGGTAVTVKPGDSITAIARRYGVPVSAVEQANNIGPGGAIHPGQRLVIPRYKQASTPPSSNARLPVETAANSLGGSHSASGGSVHVVAPGDTLSRISKLYGKSIVEIAHANNIEPGAMLKIGERLTIPGVRTSKAHKETGKVGEAKPVTAPPSKAAPVKQVASIPPTQSAAVVTPAADTPVATTGGVKAVEGAPPSFRWPVKGRVIAGYGPKTNGQQNDGINLAVPEGTPIKASEDGVVAYAGNELKGYGNLVLIRHSQGYVTAYAHAKELLVKRGDHIKRGQVIAKAGQTGNVDAPQLHFEIRKGPSPLDPIPLLHGG